MAPRYGENWAPPDGNPACRCAACTDCHQNLGVSAEVPGKKNGKCPHSQLCRLCIEGPEYITILQHFPGLWQRLSDRAGTQNEYIETFKVVSPFKSIHHFKVESTASHRCKSGNYEIVTKDKVSEWVSALYRILPRPGHKVIIFLTGDSLCSEERTQAATNALLLLLWHLSFSWQLFRAWAILHSQPLPNCEHINERVLYKY